MAKSLATARQSTIVKLVLDDGTEGYGEAWGIPGVNLAYLPLLRSYLVGERHVDLAQAPRLGRGDPPATRKA